MDSRRDAPRAHAADAPPRHRYRFVIDLVEGLNREQRQELCDLLRRHADQGSLLALLDDVDEALSAADGAPEAPAPSARATPRRAEA